MEETLNGNVVGTTPMAEMFKPHLLSTRYNDWAHLSSVRNLTGPHTGIPHVVEEPPTTMRVAKHVELPRSESDSPETFLTSPTSSVVVDDGEDADSQM